VNAGEHLDIWPALDRRGSAKRVSAIRLRCCRPATLFEAPDESDGAVSASVSEHSTKMPTAMARHGVSSSLSRASENRQSDAKILLKAMFG
jgi:hypothetical protein